jgi:hypothetical protein
MNKTLITGKAPKLPELKLCSCHDCIHKIECMTVIEHIYTALNILGVDDATITLRECRRYFQRLEGGDDDLQRLALRVLGH